MKNGRVLLLENIDRGAKDNLERAGFEVELLEKSLPSDELVRALEGAVAVGIRSKTTLSAQVLEAAESLLAVGAFCIGTNQIALDCAHRRGVPTFNAPFSNTRSVAEMVLAEIVALARKLGDRSQQVHSGRWLKSASGCHEVRHKTLGIVGYGHIGRQVGVLAEFFGMRVVFYDVVSKLPMGNNRPAESLEALLEQSDFVTLHVPATPTTANMMGAAQLARMKSGSYLLNLSRGNVVVIEDLADALGRGHLAGAAVDVFPSEPRTNDDVFKTPLAGLNNVILTPHIGGSTEEAQVAIGQEVSHALVRYLRQGSTVGAVNFPSADLARREGVHRIQHIHRNVPGVLQDVHRIVAAHGGNVSGQVLVTDETIGYLLMDIEESVGKAVVEDLSRLPTTERVRLVY